METDTDRRLTEWVARLLVRIQALEGQVAELQKRAGIEVVGNPVPYVGLG